MASGESVIVTNLVKTPLVYFRKGAALKERFYQKSVLFPNFCRKLSKLSEQTSLLIIIS